MGAIYQLTQRLPQTWNLPKDPGLLCVGNGILEPHVGAEALAPLGCPPPLRPLPETAEGAVAQSCCVLASREKGRFRDFAEALVLSRASFQKTPTCPGLPHTVTGQPLWVWMAVLLHRPFPACEIPRGRCRAARGSPLPPGAALWHVWGVGEAGRRDLSLDRPGQWGHGVDGPLPSQDQGRGRSYRRPGEE